MAITAETRTDIIDLVVAALDVAPGTTLLNELVALVDGGSTLADVAANLTARTDYQAKYPAFQTSTEWATEWLGNLIPEADTATMDSAVTLVAGMVNAGSTQASIILEAATFLTATTTTSDASFGTVATAFVNNSAVAAYHTVTKENAAIGTSTLSGVDSTDASVTTAKASVDTVVSTIAGETYTLVKDLDAKTLGAGDDTANSANTATTTTLNSGDTIDGGDGSDTLAITNTSANAALGSGATVTNTEKVSVNAVATTTLDMTLFSGVTDIYNNGSLSALTLSGVGSYIPNVHLTATSADTTVTWASAATTVSTSDAMTVAMSSAALSSSATLTAQGIETFNVLASTDSGSATATQTLVSTSAETVAITGTAATNITVDLAGATATKTGTVTGNAAANIMSVTADAADKISVDLGAGDDTLTMSQIGALYTLAGGDGADTLSTTQAIATGASASATISGFTTLSISDAGTGTIDIDDFEGGFTKVIYDAGLGGATTVDDAVTGIEVEVDVTTTAQNLTVDLKTDGATDAITVTLDAIGAGDNIGTINASDAETLTISVDDDTTDATGTIGIAGITLGDATSVSISGDAATTITTFTNPTTPVLTTFNAGGMTDAITLSGLNLAAAGATITLGSGNDSITMSTGDGADTIDISAGGANTITYTALAQSDAAGMDIITGFVSGSDDIDLTGLGVTTTSLFGGVGATKTAAEGLLAATATNPTAVFQADDSVLWVDVSDDNTLGAGDLRIQLTGVSTIVATDLNLATSGATSAATAASAILSTTASTNMTATASNENDTITSTSAFSVGSTFDGGQGTDSLTFSLTTGTTTVDLDDAAGDVENIETVSIGTGITQLNIDDLDFANNAAGEIATISGVSATAQSLLVTAASNLTDTAISNIETLTMGGATLTLDEANVAAFTTAITGSGGGADALTLDATTTGGAFDFSSTLLTAVETLVLGDALTITADAADLNDVTAITATGATAQTLTLNDADDLSGITTTNTIGTLAFGNFDVTVDADNITAFPTAITGSDGAATELTFAPDAALDFTNIAMTGVTILDLTAADNKAITFNVADLADIDSITFGADDNNMVILDTGSVVGTPMGAGFDALALSGAGTVTADETLIGSDLAALDGNATGTQTLAITMSGTTLDMGLVAAGGTQGIVTTVTGTTGNDTITTMDAKATGSTLTLTGNGGGDQFRLEDLSGNAADGMVLADAVSITDFDPANDSIAVAAADFIGTVAAVASVASAGLVVDAGAASFAFINNATVTDFTSLTQLAGAVGIHTADTTDEFYVAVANAAGTEVGVYNIVNAGGATNILIDAADTVTLVAVLTISSGTFSSADMAVY